MRTALDLLNRRLDDSADVTLRDIVTGAERLRHLSPDLSRALSRYGRRVAAELSAASSRGAFAELMVDGYVRYLLGRYQFLRLTDRHRLAMSASYRTLADEVAVAALTDEAPQAIEAATRVHHDELQAITTDLLCEVGALDAVLDGAAPVCGNYTADLQLGVLGLLPSDVAGPLLDLGCGEAASLVRHLRSEGFDAIGVDRLVDPGEGVMRGDWFSPPVLPGGWQTIVSHLGFSLHFRHAHLHSEQEAAGYAAAYVAILRALRPGGAFLYAPGLPFIETLLDRRRYAVSVRRIRLPAVAGRTDVDTATRITRLA